MHCCAVTLPPPTHTPLVLIPDGRAQKGLQPSSAPGARRCMKSSADSNSTFGVAQLPSECPKCPAIPAGVPFLSAASRPQTEAGGMLEPLWQHLRASNTGGRDFWGAELI